MCIKAKNTTTKVSANKAWERLGHAANRRTGATDANRFRFFMPKIATAGVAVALGTSLIGGITPAYATCNAFPAHQNNEEAILSMSNPYSYLSDMGYQESKNKLTTNANTVPTALVEGYTLTDLVKSQPLPPTKELYEKAVTAGYDTPSGSVSQPLVHDTVTDVIEQAVEEKEETVLDAAIEVSNVEESAQEASASRGEKESNEVIAIAGMVIDNSKYGDIKTSLQNGIETFNGETENDTEADELDAVDTSSKKVVSEEPQETDSELSRKLTAGKADNEKKAEIKENEEKQEALHAEENLNKAIIAAAESQLGTPYVWGGTTPNGGLDCSGFTQYVYSTVGIDVTRTSETQFAAALEVVPVDEAEVGDILYTSGHVGIYAGGDEYIHAPTEGDVVRYATGIHSFSHALRFTGTVA